MKLHTREQAPKEGAAKPAEKSKPMAQAREAACALCRAQSPPQWKPTLDTYASFLAENKVLYDTIESLIASSSDPSRARHSCDTRVFWLTLSDTASDALPRLRAGARPRAGEGHRGAAGAGVPRCASSLRSRLTRAPRQGVSVPAAASAGATYAEYLTTLAATDVPSFICHFYNVYFAHTAGGRMIGASIVQALALPPQSFYAWDGDLQASMHGVRTNINAVAEKWSDGEKERCLKETAKSFEMSGGLLRLLVSEPVAA